MPELPEVETVRRGLAPILVGATITAADVRRPDLRFPFPDRFATRLTGRRVLTLARRAKYLLATLDGDETLLMHLGMSGSFRIEATAPVDMSDIFHHARSRDRAHDHVVLNFGETARVIYNDPRRFGFMLLIPTPELPTHPFFARLGVEPLGETFDGTTIAEAFAGRRVALKAALLDQTRIAGLGNIYVCEALHRAGLSPRRLAATLVRADGRPTERAHRLAAEIRAVLEEAVAAGGSSLRDHRQTDGTLGYFQHRFRVYDRVDAACPTPRCDGIIRRLVQNGRSTFFCGTCQR
jgi:formamidopyrimidine-DNA glycosylase